MELYHHGILGQKWGVRRYQYEDGSLTPEGKKRYGVSNLVRDTIADNYTKNAHSLRQNALFKTRPYDEHTNRNDMRIAKLTNTKNLITSNMAFKESMSQNKADRLKLLKYDDSLNIGKRIVNNLLDRRIKIHEGDVAKYAYNKERLTQFYDVKIDSYKKSNDMIEKAKREKLDKYDNYAKKYEDTAKKIRGR